MARSRPQLLEAGAVETEMRDDSVPVEESQETVAALGDIAAETPPDLPLPTSAMLTGPQVAEIRTRNETVDRAQQAAKASADKAQTDARLAVYGQEALTAYVGNLVAWHGLDPEHRYEVDLNRGLIVDRGLSR